jgi:hypothetical protein
MRRTMRFRALLVISAVAAGCAAFDGSRTIGTCPGNCTVKISVADGNPCAIANPDLLHVIKPNVVIRFELVTPGYHFGPGRGVTIKDDPRREFTHDEAGSGPRVAVYHDKDGGGTHCHVDPLVVNG